MNRTRAILACAAMALPLASQAMELQFPSTARETAEKRHAFTSYSLPVSAFRDGAMDRIRAEGPVRSRVWRIASSSLTTLQILDPLREQLKAEGFTVLFECADRDCGGFDFRFRADVLPEPDMHVDLGDFRYLAARRGSGEAAEYVALMVSRSSDTGFVQITEVGGDQAEVVLTASTKSPDPELIEPTGSAVRQLETQGGLVADLKARGRVTLEDLAFATGSSRLDGSRFGSLEELAAYLKADPGRSIVLVGHTDAEGSVEGNIALSRKRAQAVADVLVRDYGVPAGQISAKGVGSLAPRATNDTAEGRAMNRRVEAVLATMK